MDITKDPSLNLLGSADFVPEKYVRDLSQNYVGGSELQTIRKKVHALSEETSNNLKKNVYQNYGQFIDTAKEISHLESEMYQLSHLLSEQKLLLNALTTTSILGDDTNSNKEKENENEINPEDENKQKKSSILEKVEGCKDVLDVPGRTYLHEGDLLELDPLENTPMKTVHVYLFNDGFMITKRNSNGHGLMKYSFEVIYELGSLAVVNVRDLGNVKYAFKLLIFPDTRVFQCSSNSSKKEWLDRFDQAKKARLTQEQQRRESLIEKSPSKLTVNSVNLNPFDDPEEEVCTVHPEWFLDIPEELDVCVAQRHFEDAINLLQKGKEYVSGFLNVNNHADHFLMDIQRKIELRQNNLTQVLLQELEIKPDKSLQGGLRAARRAVRLLNQLGQSTQSCDLFLKLCSSMLKIQCKRVKREGSTTMYIRHLSSVVFTNMCHMTEEFLRAFPETSCCSSAYIVWANMELNQFSTHFIKQVFMPQTSLATITECVVLVRAQCDRLCSYGIDLNYQLDGSLFIPLTKALKDTRDKLIDSVKLRALEDKWIPTNLRTKSGLVKCLSEHREMGLKLDSYVTGDTWLQLTPNTVAFTKVFLALIECCLRLKTTELMYTMDSVLYDIYVAQIKHYEQSLKDEIQDNQKDFIKRNAEFLLNILLEVVQRKYKKANGFECKTLLKLQSEFSNLLKGIKSTKTKYSSEYL